MESDSVDLPANPAADVVLLDYRLASSLTAMDVARQVKNALPTSPIMVLSESPWMPEEMNPHAVAFVRKGEPQNLLQAIAGVLQDRESVG